MELTRTSPLPLRVAIEGVCLSGKTTLTATLATQLDATRVSEYSDLAPLPAFPPPNLWAARTGLIQLLAGEVARTRLARAATRLVLLDRSPLSLIAHEYAVAALGAPADPLAATAWLSRAADAGAIDPPHAYIHLRAPDAATLAARRRSRPPLPRHLTVPIVRERISGVYDAYFNATGPGHVLGLDSAQSPTALAEAAAAFITGLLTRSSATPPPPWTVLDPLFTSPASGAA